jgi:murein DD-endopeptidase MepM/ murein hydrolase activator NlpD
LGAAYADVLEDERRAEARRSSRRARRLRIAAAAAGAVAAGAAAGAIAVRVLVLAPSLSVAPPSSPAPVVAAVEVRAAPAPRPLVALPLVVERLIASSDPAPLASAGNSFLTSFLASLPAQERESEAAQLLPVVEAEIGRGDTLASALARQDVPAGIVAVIARELRPHFDFRRARAGHGFRLERDGQGDLVSFEYRVSALERFGLRAKGEGFEAWRSQSGLLRQQARLAGVVSTTLYDAVEDLGERPQLAADFANIFAWDVDFAKAIKSGDEFRVLYERTYAPRTGEDGLRYVGPGRILAARFKSTAREVEAIYYETEPGRGGYYRLDGTSVRQAFLAAPLHYSRISSSYTTARFHPILRVTRPHPGIDYAAPSGSPVWAVANGRVAHVGWAGGFGRLVKIEHADGYTSYYGHLSRFAEGLRVGSTVRQKQVLGSVGSSGLSTGPHVCFRITKNGKYVNPQTVRMPSGDRIPADQRQDFETVRESRLAQLGPAPIVATHEAM